MKALLHLRLAFLVAVCCVVVHASAGIINVTVQPTFDGMSFPLGAMELTNRAGNVLSVTRLDFLLSEFALVRSDGGEVALTDQFAYLSAAGQRLRFTLSGVPAGQFISLKFRVGLGREVNHADPTRFSSAHPLNPMINQLHWGWQGGYVFLALEGNWHERGGQIGGYSFHLATDALTMRVAVPVEFMNNDLTELALTFDVARLFSVPHPIVLDASNSSTHSRVGDQLALQLQDNVVGAFRAAAVQRLGTSLSIGKVASVREIGPDATPYRLKISKLFPQPALPADNPLTEEGVALGRRLFRDTALSSNGRQSCASCHQAEAAFTDPGKRFSIGAEGQTGMRNVMPLANLAWQRSFFWDGRAASLREQVLQPIVNPVEMNQSLTNLVRTLEEAGYRPAFQAAFGYGCITSDRVARALEQFLLTLTSHHAKFDRVARGEAAFTAQEQRGFELFHTEYDPRHEQFGADCFHCHGGPLFTDFGFHNNGLDAEGMARDKGRFLVTLSRADEAKFKTPSLRNIARTGPYMHDGRFQTLEEVVEHYCQGVKRSATLDPNLAKHPEGGLRLSNSDKAALVAFLRTLTDEQLLVEFGSAKAQDRP